MHRLPEKSIYKSTVRQGSILFLKAVVIFISVAVFIGMIRFPQTEGRAANLSLINIYKDPFIIYIYIASIPFFVALYQTFKLLVYIDKNNIFSQAAVNALRNIKYCAAILIAFMIAAEAFLFIVQRSKSDDIAGGVAMGVFIIFISLIIVAAADVLEKVLQKIITK